MTDRHGTDFDASRLEAKFKEHLQYIDDTALIVLKGHLLIEEALDSILSTCVFHPEFLAAAALRFSQNVDLARSLSLDDHENPMWNLARSLNTLRNELAHSLRTEKRERKIAELRRSYLSLVAESPDELKDPDLPEQLVVYWSVALLLGFLDAFEAEARRFREWVDGLDKIVNPHRHEEPGL